MENISSDIVVKKGKVFSNGMVCDTLWGIWINGEICKNREDRDCFAYVWNDHGKML